MPTTDSSTTTTTSGSEQIGLTPPGSIPRSITRCSSAWRNDDRDIPRALAIAPYCTRAGPGTATSASLPSGSSNASVLTDVSQSSLVRCRSASLRMGGWVCTTYEIPASSSAPVTDMYLPYRQCASSSVISLRSPDQSVWNVPSMSTRL